jgi:hypothetical protein
MEQLGCLCPRLELLNNVLLVDAREPHFYEQVHGEAQAVQYKDAKMQFHVGVLLSALLCEPHATLARTRLVLLGMRLQLRHRIRREKAGSRHLCVWEWQVIASFGDTSQFPASKLLILAARLREAVLGRTRFVVGELLASNIYKYWL